MNLFRINRDRINNAFMFADHNIEEIKMNIEK